MRGRRRVWWAAIVLVCLPAATFGASTKELKRLDKQAGKSLARGNIEAALEAYREILASTEPGEAIRANALYTDLISKLSSSPADMEGVATSIEELTSSFSRHPQSREIAVVGALMDRQAAAEAESIKASEELARQVAECTASQEAADAARAAEPTDTCRDSRTLERKLSEIRAQLETTKNELAKKDAALAKLKEALVSGG